jgi:hypothetical protein
MVRQAALGAAKLMELKMLHGALRPQNLFIDEAKNVKLLLPPVARDYAATPRAIDLSSAKQSSELLRQADYLAPEMAQNGQSPDALTEVYALGCTLFQMLARRPPFGGRDLLAKLASHGSDRVPTLDSIGVPQAVSQLLAKMMAKDRARRLRQPREVAESLAQVLELLDPGQLRQVHSPQQNKLQEFEAWLHPYQLASGTKSHFVPELEMSPVLAASFPQPPASTPGETPGGGALAGSGAVAGAPATAIGAAVGVDDFLAPAGSKPAGNKANVNAASRMARPQVGDSVTAMAGMVFPPDDDGFFGPISTAKPAKPQAASTTKKRPQRKVLAAALAVIVLIVVGVAWAVLHKGASSTQSAPGGEGSSSTSTTGATPSDSNSTGSPASDDSKGNSDGTLPGKATSPEKTAAPGNSTSAGKTNAAGSKAEPTPGGDSNSKSSKGTPAKGQGAEDGNLNDANPLWVSPTHGVPLSLAHLPPGVQAVLVLRPAELLHLPDGEKLLSALGPDANAVVKQLESLIGAPLTEFDRLTIGWIDQLKPGETQTISPVYIVQLQKKPDVEKRNANWDQPVTPVTVAGGEMFKAKPDTSVYIPTKGGGKVMVVGASAVVLDVAAQAGEAPPLRREMEKLLLKTDGERLATLVFLPSAGAVGGATADTSAAGKVLAAIRTFFGDDTRAAELSAHLAGGNLFLEVRMQGPLADSAETVANRFLQRLNHLDDDIEAYLASINLDSYAKRVLLRFPQMLKVMAEFTRGGTEADQAVLRCYLPAAAAHNLLMGAELATAERAGSPAGTPVAAAGGGGEPKAADSIDSKLKRVTSLTFVRDTLEKSLNMLADDIGVKIEILGSDLQLEGITKNQSFGLDEKDKPAGEILRTIMLKANSDGKLVYVIKPRQAGGEEVLTITTRAAVAKRGDTLPPELVKPPAKEKK